MAEKKQQAAKVGDLIEVTEGAVVRRPDGVEVTVTGGSYVLTQSGSYEIDGNEMEARA